jgi:uncharacterized protein (TIGR02246 family)
MAPVAAFQIWKFDSRLCRLELGQRPVILGRRRENNATETTTMSGSTGEHEAIKNTMSSYETALNASSTDAAMALYTEDAVFMVPHNLAAVGKVAVRQAYNAVFKAITLKVKFTIAELVVIAPHWAFVRTNSAGTQKINATGVTSAEANQELFILKKDDDGKWRIARYAFSTTNPMSA